MRAAWPTAGVVDKLLLSEMQYFVEASHDFRVRIKKMVEMRGKVSHTTRGHQSEGLPLLCLCVQRCDGFARPQFGVIYVATEYPKWQQSVLLKLRELYNEVSIIPL